MKKICSILLLVILLLNSSVLTIISTAVEDIQESTIPEDKIKMDLSYTQLTNKLQNEIVITGSLKRNSEDDPLYNEIVDFAIETGKVSASLLQRRFRLGYNRAARIVDLLEERGVIGPQNGSKPREVLIKMDKQEDTEE